MILRNIRLLAVAPGQDWVALLRELVQKYRPNVVCLIDFTARDLDAARAGDFSNGVVLIDARKRGWHQVGPLLLVAGGNEVLVVGVVAFCSAAVMASFGSVKRTEAVDPGELNYTVVRFRCLAGHVLGAEVEVAP